VLNGKRKGGGVKPAKLNAEAHDWLRLETLCGKQCAQVAMSYLEMQDQLPLHVSLWLSTQSKGDGQVAVYATRVIEYFESRGQLLKEAA
jgi:hypothetical protein